jgi:hypothetical protein
MEGLEHISNWVFVLIRMYISTPRERKKFCRFSREDANGWFNKPVLDVVLKMHSCDMLVEPETLISR